MANIGVVLKQLRERQGLTQDELARKAKLTKPYISQLESGVRRNPSVAAAKNLARALGVDVNDLLVDDRREGLQLLLDFDADSSALPPAFAHFKDLLRIHVKQILKLDRKPPMHAATLLILVAYETLSKLLGRPEGHDIFAENLRDRRGLPLHVGRVLFHALRDGLAHDYRAHRIVVGRKEIAPVLAWKNAEPVHLKIVGGRMQDGHFRLTALKDSGDGIPRLCVVVEELWKDLDAFFTDLTMEIRMDPKQAGSIEANARMVLAGDDMQRRPQGPALDAWRDYLQKGQWEGRSTSS